jgi:hypothetical protein
MSLHEACCPLAVRTPFASGLGRATRKLGCDKALAYLLFRVVGSELSFDDA